MKSILTIAGFDPSSGAGITRDMDTFFSLGIHGLSIPTCTVAQGPRGVKHIYPTPIKQFKEMVTMTGGDLPFHGVKVGVVCDDPYIREIAALLKKKKGIPVVVDTVFAAKNGKQLITGSGLKTFIKSFFSLATVVTPNIEEASRIVGMPIKTIGDMKEAAQSLMKMGPQAVIIKGGHLKGDPVDIFYDGKEFAQWEKKRLSREVHGTGCSFSSLIVSFLVLGYCLKDALFTSEELMEEMLKASYRIDKEGYFYMSTGIMKSAYADRWKVIHALQETRERLLTLNPVELIPEVQMNLGYAIEGAKGIEDVAAFPGRIGRYEGRIQIKGDPVFGASSHVARLIITYMRYYPRTRSCVNVRYGEAVIKKAQERKMNVAFFDRMKAPDSIEEIEGKSLDFIVDQVMRKVKRPPDMIYDKGDVGKEPMIRLFAKDPVELIQKMEMIRP
jgi:hydroxymethylpyrimidine/phosphomethylpyrimidine kinase